jgi:PAS domain S-box-containing protein
MPTRSTLPSADGQAIELRFLRAEVMLCRSASLEPDEHTFLNEAAQVIAETSGAASVGIVVASPHDDEFHVRALWPMADTADATAAGLLEPDDDNVFWMPFVMADEIAGFVSFRDSQPRSEAERTHLLAHIDDLLRVFETQWAAVQVGYRYRLAIASIEDGLFNYVLNESGERTYIFATGQFEGLFGVSPQEIVGPEAPRDWLVAGLDSDGRLALEQHHSCLKGGAATRTVFEYTRPDGETRWLREDATPRRESTGRLTVTGIVVDVTEQELAERLTELGRKAAEAESDRKTTFIATLSHELRTPLATVHGFSEMLRRELGELPPGAPADHLIEFAEAVEERSGELLRIVDDLMDLSNLESGLLAMSPTPIDLRQVATDVAAKYVAVGADVSVAPGPTVTALADHRRVLGIVDRILSNAVKFGLGAGVAVVVRPDGPEAIVEITDSGVGMSASQLETVFEPFVQADARLNRSFEGVGLGLTVAGRLVAAMGGSVEVESTLGVGTTVTLRLPAAHERTSVTVRQPVALTRRPLPGPRSPLRSPGEGEERG